MFYLILYSGYDFGYLLKVLNNTNLPTEEAEFFELLKIFFPRIYDVKYLMKSCKNLKGGLQEVSELLEVRVERQRLSSETKRCPMDSKACFVVLLSVEHVFNIDCIWVYTSTPGLRPIRAALEYHGVMFHSCRGGLEFAAPYVQASSFRQTTPGIPEVYLFVYYFLLRNVNIRLFCFSLKELVRSIKQGVIVC